MSVPVNDMTQFSTPLPIPEAITRNTIIPFLGERSLCALTWTCKYYRKEYKDKHADKKVAAEMLHCVLNPTEPNQARFLQLLSTPKKDLNGLPLYLIRNPGEEVYFNSAKQRKTKTIRKNTHVLEAILRTKNFHLAKTLFNCIPNTEKTDNLKKLIKEIKSQEMWGMPELQAAYKTYIDSWHALFDANNEDELNRLWGCIGQALKEHLPWFSIYLFCHPDTHSEANYTLPPNWVCLLWDDKELDLDSFGLDSFYALHKGRLARRAVCLAGWAGWQWSRADSLAFAIQYKVLSAELDKTIKLYGLDEAEPVLASRPARG